MCDQSKTREQWNKTGDKKFLLLDRIAINITAAAPTKHLRKRVTI
ncbi:hypothetical protein JCM19239_3772 [Vibrio variabilis]|uniref:Uncharacterized protein n=1 Tax=Vibrio variabilis TaxID=990271 RepID=A0ABQ0J9P7_9VIBR|nr:hypothetical protein JCM19239_3772 [Vibrio variabilis]